MALLVDLEIKELFFGDASEPALSGIELQIQEGEFVVITGPVAAGKSALCLGLTGAVPHFFPGRYTGRVVVNGMNLANIKLPEIAGHVGYMLQDPQSQMFSVSVEEDVAFGPGNLGLPRAEINRRTREALEFVGLPDYGARSPETLSGGEAQRAVLAGVMALEAPLLVLDQPTAEMDPAGRRDIFRRLGELCRIKGTTVVLVADQVEELIPYATRYLEMQDGRIVRDSNEPPIPSQVKANAFVQAQREAASADAPREATPEVIRIQDCTFTYPGGQEGCRDVSLSLHKGELVALLGLNGSGKTTIARHFNGLASPAKGGLYLKGRELTSKDLTVLRKQVGFLFQNPDNQIFANSVEEECGFSLKLRKVAPAEIRSKVEEVLRLTGLLPYRSLHPHRLSRGQRQLLALASILVSDPDIIVADEPTAGLTGEAALTVVRNLARLADEGRTVLWVTHDLKLAAGFAHRIVAMHRHRLVLDIPVGQLHSHTETLGKIGLDFPECSKGKEVIGNGVI